MCFVTSISIRQIIITVRIFLLNRKNNVIRRIIDSNEKHMKWISRLTERSQVHPPDNNYWIDNGFQYVAVPWLKRLIEATLKCKGLMALEDVFPVWTVLNSSDSSRDYYQDGWHMLSFLSKKTVAAAFFFFATQTTDCFVWKKVPLWI